MTTRAALRWPERIFFIFGLLLLGLWFKNNSEARTFHSAETKKLEAARLVEGPWCPAQLESGVFGRIEIPRLGISALIAEGTGPAQLDRAVGHISSTVFPGQLGNCALAGHRDSFLRGLGDVRENDVIRIDTLQDTYTYAVEWGTVVEPCRVDVLDDTASPSLTVVTCFPFHDVGPAPRRFVVRARLIEAGTNATSISHRTAPPSQGRTAEGR